MRDVLPQTLDQCRYRIGTISRFGPIRMGTAWDILP
jgi:hypothetical protein